MLVAETRAKADQNNRAFFLREAPPRCPTCGASRDAGRNLQKRRTHGLGGHRGRKGKKAPAAGLHEASKASAASGWRDCDKVMATSLKKLECDFWAGANGRVLASSKDAKDR